MVMPLSRSPRSTADEAHARLGIEAGRRLVQQQQRRLVDDRLRDREALAQAARQSAGLVAEPVQDLHALGRQMHAGGPIAMRYAKRRRAIGQALPHGQLVIETVEVRQEPHAPMRQARRVVDVRARPA